MCVCVFGLVCCGGGVVVLGGCGECLRLVLCAGRVGWLCVLLVVALWGSMVMGYVFVRWL